MPNFHVTTLIFGGGVAGLWTLDELRRAGRSALLVENGSLGGGQTVASQGILHSGLKYSLAGMLTPSAREARQMPELWRKCLRGEAEPNLVSTRIIAESFLLWGTDSAASRLGMFGAKLGLQVTPQTVAAADRPAALRGCTGSVYRVDEQVISPPSLIESLVERNRDAIVQIDGEHGVAFADDGRSVHHVCLRSPLGHEVHVTADWLVLSAGRGNAALRERLGLSPKAMQTRPLHMVLARGELPKFQGHCVDGAKTRVSITSDRDASGRVAWQIGGQVAEDGVAMSSADLIAHTQAELRAVMPMLNLDRTEWATYGVDRAEGATATGGRPESFRLLHEGRVLTAWPTKLVLAPQLAQTIVGKVSSSAGERTTALDQLIDWPRPSAGLPPWERDQNWMQYVSRRAAA